MLKPSCSVQIYRFPIIVAFVSIENNPFSYNIFYQLSINKCNNKLKINKAIILIINVQY